jgi:hypothetical protein
MGTAFDGPVAAALDADPRARPSPLALAAGLAAGASGAPIAPLPVDQAAKTVSIQRQQGGRASDRSRPALITLAAFAVVLAGLLALSGAFGNRGGTASRPTPPPTRAAVVSPSPTPSPTPSPSPSPTPSPTPPPPPPDPAAGAFEALARVDQAIDELDGYDEVSNRDIAELRRRARDLREALEDGEYEDARRSWERLADGVDRVDDEFEGDLIEELKDAVADLDEAIPSS